MIFVILIIFLWSWYNFFTLSRGKEAGPWGSSIKGKYQITLFKLSAKGRRFFKYFWLLVACFTSVILVLSLRNLVNL